MADVPAFRAVPRAGVPKRPVQERLLDFKEIETLLDAAAVESQSSRCMDCGIPFCHAYGCPLGNRVPDINDLIRRKQWRKAVELLHSTNNFPEFTGRVCPAPCEEACTLAVHKEGVSIRLLELHLIERAWAEGWIKPEPPAVKSGNKVGVIGSGPAGLAAAQTLARAGHEVVVFESADRAGGLLRYGIPDFKLAKQVIDRRLDQMREEGVFFETGVTAGEDLSVRYLRKTFDALLVTTGAREPRELSVPGRPLSGVHFALEYLTGQNWTNAGDVLEAPVSARGRKVVVVGGGDTGSDCIGTARRQGAAHITQIELLPEPPAERAASNPWPAWPLVLKTTTSHEEGAVRKWSVLTKEIVGRDGWVSGLRCVKIEWKKDASGRMTFSEIPGSEFTLEADLVLLATGFLHVRHDRLLSDLNVPFTPAGGIQADPSGRTPVTGVFAAGDCVRGPSLVVHAIQAGRTAAAAMDGFLKTET